MLSEMKISLILSLVWSDIKQIITHNLIKANSLRWQRKLNQFKLMLLTKK